MILELMLHESCSSFSSPFIEKFDHPKFDQITRKNLHPTVTIKKCINWSALFC
jgi:excinuclease UvrABC ATPase subunit